MQGQLSKAAKLYVEESHQLAAWNHLESQIPDEVLDEFLSYTQLQLSAWSIM